MIATRHLRVPTDFNTTPKGEPNWHLVEAQWFCNCADIENCLTERYVADIRTLIAHTRNLTHVY